MDSTSILSEKDDASIKLDDVNNAQPSRSDLKSCHLLDAKPRVEASIKDTL